MDIVVIVLQSLLALMFLMAGFSKLAGVKMHADNFAKWGLPQWFRIVAGLVEVIGAAALIVGYWEPSWSAVGGLIIGVTGIGGVLTHVRAKDSFKETMPILLLGLFGFIVFFVRLSDLSDFPGFN
ncbi:DoxX family protein [Paenibacillus sp. NEAU-GSW1]|uniref:DoxX family protein n=1 Tax=Paenibacillus sp. NEAU-GSW1 TaxID=2682486 RepID=UPI0012E2D1A1|nr:DoxX family protein [Paenibacillus sp. NEAU-GSW1]MUT66499.1 DoxX family membrane protein [Paenibacillus sp. NEAU-GSW1]